jgi:hypothetical protein
MIIADPDHEPLGWLCSLSVPMWDVTTGRHPPTPGAASQAPQRPLRPPPRRRGPKPGTSRYLAADRVLLADLRTLVAMGFSATRATRQLAYKIPGRGSPDSRAMRLYRRFIEELKSISIN